MLETYVFKTYLLMLACDDNRDAIYLLEQYGGSFHFDHYVTSARGNHLDLQRLMRLLPGYIDDAKTIPVEDEDAVEV